MSNSQHAKFSASGSHRWLACPGSLSAPIEPGAPTTSPYAEEGIRAHRLAEEVLKGQSPKIPAAMKPYVQAYVEYVRALGGKQFYEQRVYYDAWIPEGFGTADTIVLNGTHLHVCDLKYGKGVLVYADGNTQGMLYALGVLQKYHCYHDIQHVTIHIIQPRRDHFDTWTTTPEDLYYWARWAKQRAYEALKPNPPRIPGEKQCLWCPAKSLCPEYENQYLEDFEVLDESA